MTIKQTFEKVLVNNSWQEKLIGSLPNEELLNELGKGNLCPKMNNIFRAFKLTPFEKVKMVLMGHDPYPDERADGLCFSISQSNSLSKSLLNIFAELRNDKQTDCLKSTDLTNWAEQGVLMLNTALTISKGGKAGEHVKYWKHFVNKVVSELSENSTKPIVFILLGSKDARDKIKSSIKNQEDKHLILEAIHPSAPNQTNKYPFKNGHIFSKTNDFLTKHGLTPVNWSL